MPAQHQALVSHGVEVGVGSMADAWSFNAGQFLPLLLQIIMMRRVFPTLRMTRGLSQLARPTFKPKYEHYIDGKFVAPLSGKYFDNISPIDGKVFTKSARGDEKDVAAATKAARAALASWSKTSVAQRSLILNKIADKIEANLQHLAIVETIDNGKAVRETMAADLPLVVDHFRYFAGVIRSEEGSLAEIDATTVSYNIHEPIGVCGQIVPWNFPLLMAAWKIAPALAAGNTVVLKPAEQTPTSIMVLLELIGDLLPPGVLNVVTGLGEEAGRALSTSKDINKLAFTGSTETGKLIMKAAAETLIPVTLELGGKSPLIFAKSVMDHDDAFLDKAIEGAVLFALNQGEVCTCPSRFLVHEDIYEKVRLFSSRFLALSLPFLSLSPLAHLSHLSILSHVPPVHGQGRCSRQGHQGRAPA